MQPARTDTTVSPIARFGARIKGFGPVLGLLALCIAGTLLNGDFATLDNLMNVLTRTAFIGIIAVGMTFVIISGGIDLSVGSMAALIAGCMIYFMNALAQGAGANLASRRLGVSGLPARSLAGMNSASRWITSDTATATSSARCSRVLSKFVIAGILCGRLFKNGRAVVKICTQPGAAGPPCRRLPHAAKPG